MSIDWTNVNGTSFVTGPRNQGGSNFCWGFASTALIESMVRIQHGAWSVRSEGDIFYGIRYFLFAGGNSNQASDFVAANGIADPDCLPWFDTESNFTFPESASADRDGRTVKVPAFTGVNGVQAQKAWLQTTGPIIGQFDVFNDFSAFYNAGVGIYRPSAGAATTGGLHIVLIVGFDDNTGCWIAKNSWGPKPAHPNAIFRIAFGVCNIDNYQKLGLASVNPDPHTKRRHHAGSLFASGNGGAHRNLELIVNSNGNFRHYFLEPGGAWVRVGDFGTHPNVTGTLASDVAATATTFNRNFEIIGRFSPSGQNGPLQHWGFIQSLGVWTPASPLGFGPANAIGSPAFIQTNQGEPGAFDVVTRTNSNVLSHWRRINSRPWSQKLGEWFRVAEFGTYIWGGPTMVQARSGAWPNGEQGKGDLHLICARQPQSLEHWVFSQSNQSWSLAHSFGGGITGSPQLIEGLGGRDEWTTGPLELFVPGTSFTEYWRLDLSAANPQWTMQAQFAPGMGAVVGVAQGHRGIDGFDLILKTYTNKLQHWIVGRSATGVAANFFANIQ
jgi:hypothetical protein